MKGRSQGRMPLEHGEEKEENGEEDEDGRNEVAEEEEEAVMVVAEEEEERESAHWIDPDLLGDTFKDSICAIYVGVLAEPARRGTRFARRIESRPFARRCCARRVAVRGTWCTLGVNRTQKASS